MVCLDFSAVFDISDYNTFIVGLNCNKSNLVLALVEKNSYPFLTGKENRKKILVDWTGLFVCFRLPDNTKSTDFVVHFLLFIYCLYEGTVKRIYSIKNK